MASDLTAVRTYRDRMEAELAPSALEAAGVDSMIQGDGGRSPSPWMKGYQLLVRTEDVAQAADILAAAPPSH